MGEAGGNTNDYYIKRLKPEIGMEFENDDIAYEFYNTYAGHVGFSVRKSWHDKSSTNVIRTKKFVCSKAGYKDKSKEQCQRKRADTKFVCLRYHKLFPHYHMHIITICMYCRVL